MRASNVSGTDRAAPANMKSRDSAAAIASPKTASRNRDSGPPVLMPTTRAASQANPAHAISARPTRSSSTLLCGFQVPVRASAITVTTANAATPASVHAHLSKRHQFASISGLKKLRTRTARGMPSGLPQLSHSAPETTTVRLQVGHCMTQWRASPMFAAAASIATRAIGAAIM
jgi:hypothetical protein